MMDYANSSSYSFLIVVKNGMFHKTSLTFISFFKKKHVSLLTVVFQFKNTILVT